MRGITFCEHYTPIWDTERTNASGSAVMIGQQQASTIPSFSAFSFPLMLRSLTSMTTILTSQPASSSL
jgi:hypothetical protein